MLRCILVDDEKNSRIVLRDLINNFCKEIEVVGEASNVEDAYAEINLKKPELVFLDIQMPTGNGFNLLRKFETIFFDVIFITSFDKYAINAIKFSALDYLLKPVDISELVNAVKKAVSNYQKKIKTEKLIINLVNNTNLEETEKKMALHKGELVRLIGLNEISYITADGNYSRVVTIENEHFISSKTLKEFEENLSSILSFIRIHKNCIINALFLKGYSKGEPCIITMHDASTFEISRRKKQEVLTILKQSKRA